MSDPQEPRTRPEPYELGDEPFLLTEPQDQDPPEVRHPRRRKIVLGAMLAAGLLGAGAIGAFGWRVNSQKDAVLSAPDQVAGLTRDTSAEGEETADYLRTALNAEVALDATAGGIYNDPAFPDKGVLFFGGTTTLWTPGSDLETAMELMSDEQGKVQGLHDVDAGDLGGTMMCGTVATDGTDMAVCGWADHGSMALAMFPNRPEPEAAELLREFRSATQTRQ